MSAAEFIKKFIKRSALISFILALGRGLLMAIPLILTLLLVWVFLDYWFQFEQVWRQLMVFVLFFTLLGIIVLGLYPLSKFDLKRRSKNLARRLSSFGVREDDLEIANQLIDCPLEEGASEELKNTYLSRLSDSLKKASLVDCFPTWNWKKGILVNLVSMLLVGSLWALYPKFFMPSPRIYNPFSSSVLDSFVQVKPGNVDVEWGKTQEVELIEITLSTHRPELFVFDGTTWRKIKPRESNRQNQIFKFEQVAQPILYRARYKSQWGEKYQITPVKPLEVKGFDIEIQSPAYVGDIRQTQSSPELSGLAGSQVEMEIEASAELETAQILFSDGRIQKAKNINHAKAIFQFSIEKSENYRLRLSDKKNRSNSAEDQYPIHVLADHIPSIQLLSPTEDLIVGDKEDVPLTFSASDDYGINAIYLDVRFNKDKIKSEIIFQQNSAAQNIMETYAWDLRKEKLRPGHVVEYRLRAVDGNIITGPGESVTNWLLLEISSFEKGHEAIEEALKQWRDLVLDQLADVNLFQEKIKTHPNSLDSLVPEYQKSKQNLKRIEDILGEIVRRMENDPLADFGVWLEHEAIKESLAMMNQGPVQHTQSALQTNNKVSANEQLNEIAAELERITTLSEKLSKDQNARDVLNTGDDLEKLGEDLVRQLENAEKLGDKADAALKNQINELLQEAQKLLSELAKQLSEFPENLPEDFINQQALKDLDIKNSQDIMSQIQEALRQGDTQKALKLAQQFLEAAKKMQGQLSDAHDSFMDSSSFEELSNQISEREKELEEIIESQRQLLSETQELEKKRLEALLQEQKDLLADLEKRQKKVNDEVVVMMEDKNTDNLVRQRLGSQIPLMRNIEGEFARKQINKSREWLGQVLDQINSLLEVVPSTAASRSRINFIKSEETEILKLIGADPKASSSASGQSIEKMKQMKAQQSALSQKTQAFKQGMQRLSQKSASLGMPVTQPLSRAIKEMDGASQSLGGKNSQGAKAHQEGALSELKASQGALQQAQGAMGQMMGGNGPPGGSGSGGGVRAIRRGSQSGSTGSKMGKVRIPTIDEYRPPRAFREELLEGLKEKYPKVYEKIIHNYYKRLSQ